MKTQLQYTAIATVIVALSLNLNASNIDLTPKDEAYINDIPFNTEEVVTNYLYEKALTVEFEMEEEEYINDIPFNTKCIATNSLYKKAMKVNYEFEEEVYIDDIPNQLLKMKMIVQSI